MAVVVALGAPMRATYGARTTADEPHYLLTAISLWEDRDLDVSDERSQGRYLDFHAVLLPIQAEIRPDGSQVAPHDPLLPLVLAVPVGLGGWLGAKLTLAAMAGVLAGLTMVVARRRLGVSAPVAAGAALLAGLSPPLAVYGTQVYPELAAALVALAGFWWATGPVRGRAALGAAVAVVALPWLSVKYTPVAAVLAAGVLLRCWRAREHRLALLTALGLAGAGAAFIVLHQWLYGGWTAYASGSHFSDGELTVIGASPDYAGRARRIAGLLADRHFGLAAWQPAALAAVPAVAALARRRPPGSCLLLAMVAAGWLNACFVALTMHGWWWPGRQTVVVLPLLVLAIAWWADGLGRTGRRALAGAAMVGVIAYGFLLAGVLGGRHTLVVDFDRTLDPFVRIVQPLLPDGRRSHAGALVLTAIWAAVLAGLAAWGWRSAGRPRPGSAGSGLRPQAATGPTAPPPRHADPSPV